MGDTEYSKFANLSGGATLIVPSPRTIENAYGHFASFLRKAPVLRIDAMWQKIGDVVVGTISDLFLWLSAAGGCLAWLHVRLDSSPKYYGYAPYRNTKDRMERMCRIVWPNAPRSAIPTAERSATNFPLRAK